MSSLLLGLRTIIYPAPDLETAKEWWCNFLSYGPYFDELFHVGFNVEGYELGLLPDANQAGGGVTPPATSVDIGLPRPTAEAKIVRLCTT
jgi:hypothetical protein